MAAQPHTRVPELPPTLQCRHASTGSVGDTAAQHSPRSRGARLRNAQCPHRAAATKVAATQRCQRSRCCSTEHQSAAPWRCRELMRCATAAASPLQPLRSSTNYSLVVCLSCAAQPWWLRWLGAALSRAAGRTTPAVCRNGGCMRDTMRQTQLAVFTWQAHAACSPPGGPASAACLAD